MSGLGDYLNSSENFDPRLSNYGSNELHSVCGSSRILIIFEYSQKCFSIHWFTFVIAT